jgi:hypothetical protein
MSDASTADEPRRDDDEGSRDAHDTQAILARRRRFVAAALGSLSLAASAACSPPQPCLEYVEPDRVTGDASDSSSPQPCLTAPLDVRSADAAEDAQGDQSAPMPCLSPAIDAGADVQPMPCLSPPFDSGWVEQDAGEDDAAPAPCLRMLPPSDGG